MRMLTVSVLVCAVMALTAATAVPEAEPVNITGPSIEEESQIVEWSASCPSGWTRYSRRCFLYISTSSTWAAAERHCQNRGGNLASVHSFNEYQMIQNMIQRITHSFPFTWLGGSAAEQERTWLWSDGEPFRFNYWSPGEPNNVLNADCLVMNYGGHKRFDDQPCYYRRPFVCARKL